VKHKPHGKPSDPLPSDVKALQEMVAELQSQVSYLKRMLFGRRSEKLGSDPNQGTLFGASEADVTDDAEQEEALEDDEETVPPRRRRTRHCGRRPLPEHLPRCLHEIHPPPEELTCAGCGEGKTVFGQDVTEELEVVPARFFVNKYVRFKYACRKCEGYVSVGALPPRPLDKGIPGPGFLAHLISSKYADHLPLYRQQQIYRRAGLEIPRSTMCGWVSYTASVLSPIVTAMKASVMASRKVHTDDTPITVLDPSVKPVGSRKGYMWVYIGDDDDAVFDYTNSRKRDGPESFLRGYRGYLQADAFSGYDRIYVGGEVVEVACWAHARRKFFDAQSSHDAECMRILDLIGRLYAVERRAKIRGLPSERLLSWRQRYAARRLDRLRAELDRLSLLVLPRSPLGKAIAYTLNHWKALIRYTEAPYLSIDNNHSERQIKQMVIGRKNWMFAGSENGAENAAILFSIVVSCKLAGVDPFGYLRDVLTRIHSHPANRIHELAPRQWKQRFGAGAQNNHHAQPAA
jgi:transposase